MYIKMTLESQIFILKALGYVRQFTRFRALYRMPQRAMGAAITRVRVQIFDVNYGALLKLFCMKYRPVMSDLLQKRSVSCPGLKSQI